jgi:hypothetical protein
MKAGESISGAIKYTFYQEIKMPHVNVILANSLQIILIICVDNI